MERTALVGWLPDLLALLCSSTLLSVVWKGKGKEDVCVEKRKEGGRARTNGCRLLALLFEGMRELRPAWAGCGHARDSGLMEGR
mmetsp:Transcript_17183/g.34838  ORF Transcript_17183/g.34838 Transcript_17183/m.34838 type:complete len:84 (+) Transcript_17183:968-1219(+)